MTALVMAHTPDPVDNILDDSGFVIAAKPAGNALIGEPPSDWWEFADDLCDVRARFVATLHDGFALYAFIGPGQVLAWSVRFDSSTPLQVIEGALFEAANWARRTVARQRLPVEHRRPSAAEADRPVDR